MCLFLLPSQPAKRIVKYKKGHGPIKTDEERSRESDSTCRVNKILETEN